MKNYEIARKVSRVPLAMGLSFILLNMLGVKYNGISIEISVGIAIFGLVVIFLTEFIIVYSHDNIKNKKRRKTIQSLLRKNRTVIIIAISTLLAGGAIFGVLSYLYSEVSTHNFASYANGCSLKYDRDYDQFTQIKNDTKLSKVSISDDAQDMKFILVAMFMGNITSDSLGQDHLGCVLKTSGLNTNDEFVTDMGRLLQSPDSLRKSYLVKDGVITVSVGTCQESTACEALDDGTQLVQGRIVNLHIDRKVIDKLL